jgi:hypothetical protein
VEIARGGKEREDELDRVSERFQNLLQMGATNVLQELEENDAFECNELRHWLSTADPRLYGLVEAENGHNR